MSERIYLLHAITRRVEACCGSWRDNRAVSRAIDAWQAAQEKANSAAEADGLARNAYRPLLIVAADTANARNPEQRFLKTEVRQVVSILNKPRY